MALADDSMRMLRIPRPTWALADLAAGNALLHLAFAGRYGYFRDEFYYVACGQRLDWGYVDHPPFVALVARLGTTLFGTSPAALRVLPILAGSLAVVLAGLLARELGGGRYAQALAAAAMIPPGVYLFQFHILSMNVFDVLFWALGALVLARILRGGDPRLWLLFGLVAGLGLQNKHSVLFFGFGVAVGLVATPERRHLKNPWPWLGGLVALAVFLPHLLWQVRHGFPTLEFMANAEAGKNVRLSPAAFLLEQVLQMNPFTLPLWLAGLAGYFLSPRLARFRALGWIYLGAIAVMLARAAKAYYLAPAYPILFAAGAVLAEGLAERSRRSPGSEGSQGSHQGSSEESGRGTSWRLGWRWLKLASFALLIAGGAVGAPFTLPVLSVSQYQRYAAALGIQPSAGERHEMGPLPQHYADMQGWPGMVAEVARVYRSLPEAERERCAIFAQNYGEAGAIDLLGDAYGLPDALSAHNNYFLWGPREYTGECVIVLGDDRETLERIFADVRPAGVYRCPLCMPYEDGMTLHVCRRPRVPLAGLWPRIKAFG